MGDDRDDLAARVERLERRVAELAARLPGGPPPPAPVAAPAARPRRMPVRWDGQLWLNRLGIALLLLGIALLFRYSIEQGWLTPAVRVGFGAAVGLALLGTGLLLGERRRFSAVLVGGGIATFYIVGWAAFYLYGLISYGIAFTAIVAVTALAFGLALGREEPALAVVGAGGGLGTPLLLGLTRGSPAALAVYTCLILAWTAALQLRREWRAAEWTALAGGWAVLCVYARRASPVDPGDGWILAVAIAFAWLATGVVPLAQREWVRRRGGRERRWRDADALHWYGVTLAPPGLALLAVALVWEPSGPAWGALAVLAAAVYGAAAWAARSADARLARTLLLAASALLTVGLIAALDGPVLLVGLAAQALALHLLAEAGAGHAIRWAAHKTYTGAAIWLLYQLLFHDRPPAGEALGQLIALACGLAASYRVPRRGPALAYRYFVHFALLGWLWGQLGPLPGGEGLATVAWCGEALGLLVFSLWRSRPLVEKTALGTLLLVVTKLLVVDLAALDPLYRVLLFIGFGGVFLLLSYTLQEWWRRAAGGEGGTP